MTQTSSGESETIQQNRWHSLGVVMVGGFMTLVDTTIVNVAVPSIRSGLDAENNLIEWVISGYALAFGLILVVGGRLGDIYGHRRLYCIGLALFTVTSVLCGTAQSAEELVGWRVLQGLGAGLLFPQISATIQVAFPGPERARAFSMFGVTQGLSTAVGPLLGGVLINADIAGLDWRPIFLVNLPLGVVAVIVAIAILPAHRQEPDNRQVDLVGVLLLALSLMLLLVPLIEGQQVNWPTWTFTSLAAALPAFAAFTWWEWYRGRNGRQTLIRLSLFRLRGFAVGLGIALAYFSGFTSLLFTFSLFLQVGRGYDALGAGLALTPFAIGILISSSQADRVAKHLGRGVIALGAFVVLLGLAWFKIVLHSDGTNDNGWDFAGPLLMCGLGSGLTLPSLLDQALSQVPTRYAGSAGGVVATSQRIGQALGIALVGVVFFTTVNNSIDLGVLPGPAFATAMQDSTWMNIALVAVAMALTALLPKRAH